MKADLTRDTFDRTKHFSRVLMQQGRVTLDADHNEQAAILLHYLRTLARDLIGPYAAPVEAPGFQITPVGGNNLQISRGRYYVDGLLVENDDDDCTYLTQLDYPLPGDDPLSTALKNPPQNRVFWVYLDVWERHITPIEDGAIREKALNGPDTCTRAKVVWQVKALQQDVAPPADHTPDENCTIQLNKLVGIIKPQLKARVDPGQKLDNACVTPPDSQYRGTENQLYRVEIHDGGKVGTATFKWSRDNGSVATAWLGTSGSDLHVSHARGFEAGNWIELSDDTQELQGQPGVLVKLLKVEGDTLSVDPATPPLAWNAQLVNPKVRRWDQSDNESVTLKDGAVPIPQGSNNDPPVWLNLEDGVQIAFSPHGEYRTGDYWLIPARVATSEIEWPSFVDAAGTTIPEPQEPNGVEHHYAPLGFVSWPIKDNTNTLTVVPCRCEFEPLNSCFQMGSMAVGAHLLRAMNFAPRPIAEEPIESSQPETASSPNEN